MEKGYQLADHLQMCSNELMATRTEARKAKELLEEEQRQALDLEREGDLLGL